MSKVEVSVCVKTVINNYLLLVMLDGCIPVIGKMERFPPKILRYYQLKNAFKKVQVLYTRLAAELRTTTGFLSHWFVWHSPSYTEEKPAV